MNDLLEVLNRAASYYDKSPRQEILRNFSEDLNRSGYLRSDLVAVMDEAKRECDFYPRLSQIYQIGTKMGYPSTSQSQEKGCLKCGDSGWITTKQGNGLFYKGKECMVDVATHCDCGRNR